MATKACIVKLQGGERLTKDEAFNTMEELMAGTATQAQVGAFLTALKLDQVDGDIIAACAKSMRSHALPCSAEDTIDIVGTGGDGIDTFNVSTAASFIVAACGGRVMKHGSRSNSSKCGSADLLEAFGGRLDVDGTQAVEVMDQAGFCFLFAQTFHPSMRFVAAARKSIGIRSIFNILGPLTNPCKPRYALTGVFSKELAPLYADALVALNLKRAMVCHSEEGLDEISCQGITHCWIVDNGKITTRDIAPADFGLPSHPLTDVGGGEPHENRATFESLLVGKEGAVLDYVLMNAAAALWVAEKVKDFKEGVQMCKAAIKAGKAKKVMDDYVKYSNKVFEKQTILETITAHRTKTINECKKTIPVSDLFYKSLSTPSPSLINVLERIRQAEGSSAVMAEIKRASPSKGVINADIDPALQARKYAKGGAAVISVLTEEKWFKGTIDDLAAVRASVDSLPNRPAVLLKDFVVDEWQLVQARMKGADTALLIVAILGETQLKELILISRKCGMEPLVEVANNSEMDIALRAGATFIGINNRDLHTFNVDPTNTTTLIGKLSGEQRKSVVFAALSGIKTREDVCVYEKAGASAVLVGEALMRTTDPSSLIESLSGCSERESKKQRTA